MENGNLVLSLAGLTPNQYRGLCLHEYDLEASKQTGECKSGPQLQQHIFNIFLDRLWRIKNETRIKSIVRGRLDCGIGFDDRI